MTDPIRVMIGGSAANFAVHAANLNRGHIALHEQERGAAAGDAAQQSTERSSQRQSCVLHTSIASDDMGNFLRKKLDEFGVEWSQTKARKHQVFCVQ